MAEAALKNEYLTRERVDRLETLERIGASRQDLADRRITYLESILMRRGFWGRLRWLLLGR